MSSHNKTTTSSGSGKRARMNDAVEASERYASLLKQQCDRVAQRFKKRIPPFDKLLVIYCMYFMDCSDFPQHHLYRQAQLTIAHHMGRVLCPDVFELIPIAAVLDQCVEEYNKERLDEALRELHELALLREELGEIVAEQADTADHDDGSDDDNEAAAAKPQDSITVDSRDAALVRSGVLWSLCAAYIEARVAHDAVRSSLEPHYEGAVSKLLEEVPIQDLPDLAAECLAILEVASDPVFEGHASGPSALHVGASEAKGVDVPLYHMVRVRALFLVAWQKLRQFEKQFIRREYIPLNADQMMYLQSLRNPFAEASQAAPTQDGVAVDFVPDDRYMEETAAKLDDGAQQLQEDETFSKDEIHNYYLRPAAQRQFQNRLRRNNAQSGGFGNAPTGSHSDAFSAQPHQQQQMLKPHRFCKIRTGFAWTQYNKTHYTRANPPPRTVLSYEFTLFYPLLLHDKTIKWNEIYKIEDVEAAFNDEYCLLVFSPGPPYADVAYRILRQKWDHRPGRVRSSYDARGRFRLYFQFANTCYKR